MLDIATFWGEQQHKMAPAAGPGGFNDPDALIIGQNNLGLAGMRVQMSLWVTLAGTSVTSVQHSVQHGQLGVTRCTAASLVAPPRCFVLALHLTLARPSAARRLCIRTTAPLLLGADLRSLSSDAKAVLQNPDVLRIADDPLAKQGLRVDNQTEGLSIWRRELQNGDLAVLVLNTLPFHANTHDPSAGGAYTLINNNGPHLGMGISWGQLGWEKSKTSNLTVVDLWDGSKECCLGVAPDPPVATSAFAAFVPFGGCRFLRVSRTSNSVVSVSSSIAGRPNLAN